jgi:hypothetical protein
MRGDDLKLAAFDNQPCPAVGEVVHSLVREGFEQRVQRSEVALDRGEQSFAGGGLLTGQRVPVETVVPGLGRIVEQRA